MTRRTFVCGHITDILIGQNQHIVQSNELLEMKSRIQPFSRDALFLMSRVCSRAKTFFHFSYNLRNEMFSQRFSPTTGKMEWVVEDEDYDMRNEITR